MRALITGSEGFAGKYLRAELENSGYTVKGADLAGGPETVGIDLTDSAAVEQMIGDVQPDVIFHLAAMADVGRSWREPQKTMQVNIISALNLMDAVRKTRPEGTRMLMVGSSDQYGNLGSRGDGVKESSGMRPGSPYAVSKRAQEDLAELYSESYGLWICMTRSFNHGGAGQRPGFMIADFARGIARIERGEQNCLMVGNLDSKRDFTHVRDVVRAYRLITEKGRPGEIYNVGSGRAWSGREILDRLISMAKVKPEVKQDPARMRPSDTPVIRCDPGKLEKDTGWRPLLLIDDILRDTLDYYRGLKE